MNYLWDVSYFSDSLVECFVRVVVTVFGVINFVCVSQSVPFKTPHAMAATVG